MSTLSPAFEDRILAIHKEKGKKWLKSLADLQREFTRRWSLTDLQPLQDLSYNYLVFASSPEKRSVVLKLGIPHKELESEIQTLKAFKGNGMVRLLEADSTQGALLLERIIPGKDLLSVENDEDATRIAARLMKNFWIPAPFDFDFPTAADWCQGFQRYLDRYSNAGPLPIDLVFNAASISKDLLAGPQKYLLHGDLHHMNILLGENNNWVAIDPKGVIGEEAFEVGALLLNPVPQLINWPNLKDIQRKRLIILAEELDISQERLTAWSYVRAVLSAIWSVEDGEDWDYGVEIARILRDLL